MTKRLVSLLAVLLVIVLPALASDRADQVQKVQNSATVLHEILSAPDKGIPVEILGEAKCVAVIPNLLKGGFIVGGTYGNGVASCKTDKGWSAPAFFRAEGLSFGFQIGGQAVDVVMVIMNDNGMRNLLSSKFKLGADASVAAGPVGRHVEGSTDWKLRAQVLTYSRARGAFAGISLNGWVIKQHQDDTRAFYGRMVPYKTLLTGAFSPMPQDASPWIAELNKSTTGSAPANAKPAGAK